MHEDKAYVTRDMYDRLMQLWAEENDKELRESFEEKEKPKKDPYFKGFDGTNNFFKRGKRRWAQNR